MQLMSSMNKENLIFPFQSLGRFFLFFCLIVLARTSARMVVRSGSWGHSSLLISEEVIQRLTIKGYGLV